ncbi:MAG: DUF2059 domain-containing protein [Planctomycetia bacterium]|nr:DUF2059 domain-containing protein [Planctomycetia bacterium]
MNRLVAIASLLALALLAQHSLAADDIKAPEVKPADAKAPDAKAPDDKADSSHAAAVHQLFKVMHMEEMMGKSIDAMIEQQVHVNPAIARFRGVMSAFLRKHMNWATIEPDMTKIYMQEFNEDEIKKMTAFYETPLGQKVITKTPQMLAKGAALGQSRVQANIAELQQMIADEEARQRQHPGPGALPGLPPGPAPAPAPAPPGPAPAPAP